MERVHGTRPEAVTLAASHPATLGPLLSRPRAASRRCVQGVATSQFVEVAAHEPERRPRHTSGVRRRFVLPRGTLTQEHSPRPPLLPARDLWTTFFELSTGRTSSAFVSPSALSSKTPPGTTRKRTNRLATALQRSGPAPAGSYLGHSPTRSHLNHPRTTHGHRSATPAATELPRFAVDFVRLVTSVVGCPTGKSSHVRPSRGGAVSAACRARDDFGGTNTEASPYPSMTGLFPVRHRPESDSLASRFRPLMVELFAARCLASTPAAVTAGPACCHVRSSPRQRG